MYNCCYSSIKVVKYSYNIFVNYHLCLKINCDLINVICLKVSIVTINVMTCFCCCKITVILMKQFSIVCLILAYILCNPSVTSNLATVLGAPPGPWLPIAGH